MNDVKSSLICLNLFCRTTSSSIFLGEWKLHMRTYIFPSPYSMGFFFLTYKVLWYDLLSYATIFLTHS
jgi:hypothetical protein